MCKNNDSGNSVVESWSQVELADFIVVIVRDEERIVVGLVEE